MKTEIQEVVIRRVKNLISDFNIDMTNEILELAIRNIQDELIIKLVPISNDTFKVQFSWPDNVERKAPRTEEK